MGRPGHVDLAGGPRRIKGRPVVSSPSPASRRTNFYFYFFKDKLLKVKRMKPREVKIQRQKFNVEKRPCWETFDEKHRKHFTDAPEAHIVNRIKLLLISRHNIRVSFCSA